MQADEETKFIRQDSAIATGNDPFISRTNAALDDIAGGISLYSSSITDPVRVFKRLATEAGSPVVLTYRLSQSIPNNISIDVKCSFRWLDCPKKKITIVFPFPSQIKPLAYTQKNIFSNETTSSTGSFAFLSICHDLIFWAKPTMQSILNDVEQTQGMDKKNIDLYFSAYKLAENDTDRVHVIECLVNRYGKYYDYLMRSPDFHRQAPDAKIKMMYYLNCLPDNYQSVTASANAIWLNYQRIFECLSEQNIDEAWTLFNPYTKLSPFITHAFPQICAVKHLLHVVFRISGHDKYYGLDEVLYIPEHDVVFSIHGELMKAIELLTFDTDQQDFIKKYALDPIAYLLKTGSDAASLTSPEVLQLRREQEIARTREHIVNQLDTPSYRSVYEEIDAQEDPVIEELSDDLLHINSVAARK